MDNEFLRAALQYAERGWAVNPLKPNGKECDFVGVPVEQHASCDLEQIRQWWAHVPARNVGLVPGSASGFVVVDIDVKDGAGGRDLLTHLETKVGTLPRTRRESTWSGGEHLYFQHPGQMIDGVRLENVRGRDVRTALNGIEFFGTPSNIVAAPSVVSSKPYTVTDDSDLAPLPEELLALWHWLLSERKARTGRQREIPQGDRDWQVFLEACRLYRQFGDDGYEEARAELQAFNTQCCKPSLPSRQVDKCLRSAWRRCKRDEDRSERVRVDAVEQVNGEHALVFIGDKIGALWPNQYRRGEGMPRVTTLSDLRVYWADRKIGKLNPVDIWLESPERRKFNDITFRPGVADMRGDFNLWRGWPVAPVKGNCRLFLEHAREVICGGDAASYRYVIAWLANIFQEPENKPGTAIALGTVKEGTGKGQWLDYVAPLLGSHYWHLSGSDLLEGKFNDFLAGRMLIYGDESLWAGGKRTIAKIKGYITERRVAVERKCVPAFEIDLHARFIFASNEEHFAPAGREDRRFVVLKPLESKRDDIAYFEALDEEAKNGGRQALMWMLLNEVDGSTNGLRIIPKTRAHTEQKLLGLDDAGQFWRRMLYQPYHEIVRGYGENKEIEHYLSFGKAIYTDTLYEFFLDYCRKAKVGYPLSIDGFGSALRRYVDLARREPRKDEKGELGRSSQGRPHVYELPSLHDAREQFRSKVGEHIEWDTPDDRLESASPPGWDADDWRECLQLIHVDTGILAERAYCDLMGCEARQQVASTSM
jgi:hypothetical protein